MILRRVRRFLPWVGIVPPRLLRRMARRRFLGMGKIGMSIAPGQRIGNEPWKGKREKRRKKADLVRIGGLYLSLRTGNRSLGVKVKRNSARNSNNRKKRERLKIDLPNRFCYGTCRSLCKGYRLRT
ncbi:hypothetical protein EMPG_15264 [Blastomyces silverae]|uniref:Uncharacterized protein n=1 Tax=Blastomyces silverae TaxID=2060906 RepID=A0A0H1BDC7_9EURO|nr:hypothetical protein EMPG_15264 [Blastomyces silverae]